MEVNLLLCPASAAEEAWHKSVLKQLGRQEETTLVSQLTNLTVTISQIAQINFSMPNLSPSTFIELGNTVLLLGRATIIYIKKNVYIFTYSS